MSLDWEAVDRYNALSLRSFLSYAPSLIDRSRSALATTDTELRLMAAAAIIGFKSRWLESG